MTRPRQADAQRPDAVVSPLTFCWFVAMTVPAPRKPMPLMTWAPNRDTSVLSPTASAIGAQSVVSMTYSYWLRTIVRDAPMQTRVYVRGPAGRCLRPRSRPMRPPMTSARISRRKTDAVLKSLK